MLAWVSQPGATGAVLTDVCTDWMDMRSGTRAQSSACPDMLPRTSPPSAAATPIALTFEFGRSLLSGNMRM